MLPEWAVVIYTCLTLLLIAFRWHAYPDLSAMLLLRAGALVAIALMWGAYYLRPCKLTMMLRMLWLVVMLSWWYPDTYELNRILPNCDHFFAQAEQWCFGCQPALLFSQQWPQPFVSETLSLGYISYYPLILMVMGYYFLRRYDQFEQACFVILASFFLFYTIFIFLPVAGPQFYYAAVGLDKIALGQFPELHHYFMYHREVLSAPGWEDGWFHYLVDIAHDAGERPTAAFPSSHVGITVELWWLARAGRCRWLEVVVAVFLLLMFLATFYIMAHYVIDAIAGLFVGTLFFFLCQFLLGNRRL